MIAKLTGRVDSLGEDWAVIDVGGVGYLVFCSARTLRGLPDRGETVQLHIDTHVREDRIHLFGFGESIERDWYRLLQGVQGVGGRLALSILSALSTSDLGHAIAAGDKASLTRANGVGARLAQRIVVELKDKVAEAVLQPAAGVTAASARDGASADAVSALVNLGYPRVEAFGAVAAASRELGADAALDALIRHGLKELAL